MTKHKEGYKTGQHGHHKTAMPGENHPLASLTNEQAKKIRELYAKGEKPRYLIAWYNVSYMTIYKVTHNKAYLTTEDTV